MLVRTQAAPRWDAAGGTALGRLFVSLQIWDTPLPAQALQQAPGEGFLGAEGSDLPFLSPKAPSSRGDGPQPQLWLHWRDPQSSPCPICSRCPVTHFFPSPARQRWVPAHPDALNQQEKTPRVGSKQEPETVLRMQVPAPSPPLGTQRGLRQCSCGEDTAPSATTLLKIGQGASTARNGKQPGRQAQNRWLNASRQRGCLQAPCYQPPRRPPRLPGSDGCQQPGQASAEQGRVPAAGTAAQQGSFWWKGQVLSPLPHTLGQEGFYLPKRWAEPSPESHSLRGDGQALGSTARTRCPTAAGGWVLSDGRSPGQGPPSL